MSAARYFFGVLLVIFLPPGLIWWLLVHPFVDFWRKLGPRVTLTIMGVIGVTGAATLFQVRDALLVRDLGTSYPLVALAAVLFGIAVVIAVARRKHLTNRILAGVPELEADGDGGVLLTEGIYGRVRHPRYIEVAVGTLAYATFANWLGAYVVAALTLPGLHLVVLLEERELADRFGAEYEAYRIRVPRYLPRFGDPLARGPSAGS